MDYTLPPAVLMGLPSGIEGTRQTLRIMRNLALQGKTTPMVRQLAVQLTMSLPQKDWLSEINALFYFVRDNIRYVRDIRNVETLHTADRVLMNRAGDCDDKSVLLASLLESIGHPSRFVAVGFKPDQCDHVYVETLRSANAPRALQSSWMALETTEPVPPGWSAMDKGNVQKTLIMEI